MRYLTNTELVGVWNSKRKLRNFFSFKDRLPLHLCSKILYRYTCNGCNSIYLRKRKSHFLVRAYEHLGLSVRTGKEFAYNPRNANNTAILEHSHWSAECKGNLESFEMIGRADNAFFYALKNPCLLRSLIPL